MSEASNPKRRRMNQPRPSGRPGSAMTARTECHGFGVACDKHMVPLDAAVEVEPSLSTSDLRDFDVAVTGFAVPYSHSRYRMRHCCRPHPAERKCLVFLVSAHPFTRDGIVFLGKVNRCDVIHTLHYVVLPSHWATPLQQEIVQLALVGEHDYQCIHRFRWVRIRESKTGQCNGPGLIMSRTPAASPSMGTGRPWL